MKKLITATQAFSNFIEENSDIFADATTPLQVINESTIFTDLKDKMKTSIEESDSLTNGLVDKILNRQREMMIEESSSMIDSPEAISYAVSTFPILTDIYSEPLLNRVLTVFPYNKPLLTIPRQKWITKIIDEVGNVTNVEFPTTNTKVRPNFKEIDLGQSSNMFSVLGISSAAFQINQRNFKVTSLKVTVDGTEEEIEIFAAPDAKGRLIIDDVEISDGIFQLMGQVNTESGDVTFSLIPTTPATVAVLPVSIKAKFRIFGNGNGLACVKARPQMNTLEINCDIEDSFEIENITEIIQDWQSLYDLDIITIIKDYVKDQMKLNKDMEIADLLQYNIPAAKKLNQFRELDLGAFVTATGTRPTTVVDIFKNIQPVITALMERIRKTTRMDIQYIVTGIDTAAILKSLQAYSMKFDGYEGVAGQSGTLGDFAKLEIISSSCVEDDMIHLLPFSESLSKTSLLEVSYKPLYIVSETTNSTKRFFIKSRNWIGIVRNDAIGSIKIKNYSKYFGA